MKKNLTVCFTAATLIAMTGCSQKVDVSEAIDGASQRPRIVRADDDRRATSFRLISDNHDRDVFYEQEQEDSSTGSALFRFSDDARPTTFGEILKADLRRCPRSLWEDTKAVYTRPLNVGVLLMAGGGSIALRTTNADERLDREKRAMSSGWADTANVLGHPLLHLGLAASMYTYGVQARHDKTYEVGKALANALIITDLSTLVLKVSANASRPDGGRYGWPSGHTSSSFAVAAVMDHYYGPYVGVPLYGLAGFIGYARMDDRKHYFSDVLFGAALGYVIGRTVAEGRNPELMGGQIVPYVDPYEGKSGVAWIKDF